jgi:hypothetical protein
METNCKFLAAHAFHCNFLTHIVLNATPLSPLNSQGVIFSFVMSQVHNVGTEKIQPKFLTQRKNEEDFHIFGG